MKGLDDFIGGLNFKKAVKIFIALSVIIIVFCISAIAYVSRDKIRMALDYNKTSELFRKEGFNDKVKSQLNKLTYDSKDINNIIVLDKDNNIIFKANDNFINGKSTMNFAPYEQKEGYLQDNINKDIIYKPVREESIILDENYIRHDRVIEEDINSKLFFEKDFHSKRVFLLNYLVNSHEESKILIIRTVSPIPYAERLLEITGSILALIFLIYWIGHALWVYKDANRKHSNPSLWGILVLITNLVGLLIYIMYRQSNRVCSKCGVLQSKENIYCTKCGTRLNQQCDSCGEITSKNDNYCSRCGNKIKM
jgi:hypothetical protein